MISGKTYLRRMSLPFSSADWIVPVSLCFPLDFRTVGYRLESDSASADKPIKPFAVIE